MIKLRIREHAEGLGMNIQDLANASGVAYSTALSLWYDKVHRIDKITLGKMARALHVQPGQLFEDMPEVPPVGNNTPTRSVSLPAF